MSQLTFEQRDIRWNGVRSACAAIDDALARLPETTGVEQELRARWAELIEALALEPARVLRVCPTCKRVGMIEATRCGHCWAKLVVPESVASPA